MTRLTLALAVWIGLGSVAEASLALRKEPGPLAKGAPELWASRQAARAPELAAAPGVTPEFVLTEETEVLLDGEPCKYAGVPGHARIVHLEIAADRKTVLKIHFRTGR
jgi:hypothetical protein